MIEFSGVYSNTLMQRDSSFGIFPGGKKLFLFPFGHILNDSLEIMMCKKYGRQTGHAHTHNFSRIHIHTLFAYSQAPVTFRRPLYRTFLCCYICSFLCICCRWEFGDHQNKSHLQQAVTKGHAHLFPLLLPVTPEYVLAAYLY